MTLNRLGQAVHLLALPTWALVSALIPFLPQGHPWRGRFFSLADWSRGRTSFTKAFDGLLWFYVMICVLVFAL